MPSILTRAALGTAGALLAAGTVAGGAQAAFPGTNGRVAFESQTRSIVTNLYSNRDAQILTAASDGSDVQTLVAPTNEDLEARDPAISPDGKWVAYVLRGFDDEADTTVEHVHVIGIDGNGDRRVGSSDDMGMPAWSPDGKQIAYVEEEDPDELWVIDADGTGAATQIQLGEFGDSVANPQWSPDGKWIAFDDDDSIYVVAAGGGQPQIVAGDDVAGRLSHPNWAPDGSAIAFELQYEDSTIRDIAMKDGEAEGSMHTLVTANWPDRVERPAYSPDGKRVIFASSAGLKSEGLRQLAQEQTEDVQGLYTIPASGVVEDEPGTAPKLFASGDGNVLTAPDWQPMPIVEQAPAAKPPVVSTGGVAGQTQRRCGSRRYFTIRLRPRGEKLAMARVIVAGRRAKVHPGKRWTAVVDLRRLPKNRFKVDITVWTRSGKRFHEVRRYWTCTGARSSRG
jgi:Tol biopolymer transport system component